MSGAAEVVGWTIEEAAALLDPPMTAEEIRALVLVFALHPTGHRRGGRGRPAPTYDQAELLRAHAAAVTIRAGHPLVPAPRIDPIS
ncbi:hypothetical protein Aple_010540 [Acrocarpospora pleiomorpha]|uniref:HTH merR-type domain-containing protein n=2 Tax=Acrocarpospora pleiomorpha TaxID=90975 RepID=A0A5M3XD84_9ACTN|nr:hypothetical protein Aple_010540 [Acrocarpospora pleiomorpha]